MSDSIRGQLLVATPTLLDPNFRRTVVLMIDHDGDGALGVVLNRPSTTPIRDVLPPWRDLACDPAVVYWGGPVSPHGAIGLVAASDGDPADLGQPVGGSLAVVDLDADPDALVSRVAWLRVFVGYAGWSSEQLEAEIAENAWWVVDAAGDETRAEDPERLWRRVLARQPAPMDRYAMYPDDPTLN